MEQTAHSIDNLSGKTVHFNVIPTFGRRGKEFTLFCKIQEAMRLIPDFGKTCKAVLNAVIEELGAENCSLMLKDPMSGDLSICGAHGKNGRTSVYYPNHASRSRRFKSGEGIAGSVLKEGRGMMVSDVREDPRFVVTAGLTSPVRSLICYPIREKDQVVGVFNLSHSRTKAFSEGDRLALAYISNQLGAALTSARFFSDIQAMDRPVEDSTVEKDFTSIPSIHPSSTFVEARDESQGNGTFIYAGDKMHRIKKIIDQVAGTDVTILIQGQSGVGKEVVARYIHLNSSRRKGPFVKVNCAAIPQELLESELFGYEKGAFTGAYRQKPGKFELANGGTIFLDEIAEITPSLQAKLLQVLQDREFSRLGGKRDIRVDIRVLAATNRNIDEAVGNGSFREDLYYRLNVVNITIPPLMERKEEIPVFVEFFLDKFRKKYDRKGSPPSNQFMKALLQYPWPGNVRELENVIQRFIVLGNERPIIDELSGQDKKDLLGQDAVSFQTKAWPCLKDAHREAAAKAESEVIRKALELTNWNRKKAAGILNISYKALLYKIRSCGIDGRQSI